MPLFAEIIPVVTGTSGRLIAFWVELVTFALILLAGFSIVDIIGFGLLFFLGILDLTIAIRRHKQQRAARISEREYVFTPKIWLIVVDMIFASLFTIAWVFLMIFSWAVLGQENVFYYRAVFSGFAMVGCLTVAHLHWIFGGIECHLLRQMRNGNKAASRAYLREVRNDDVAVELGVTGK